MQSLTIDVTTHAAASATTPSSSEQTTVSQLQIRNWPGSWSRSRSVLGLEESRYLGRGAIRRPAERSTRDRRGALEIGEQQAASGGSRTQACNPAGS
ncbi:hypothetical protein NDU88_003993, partial [Pleurodeles waltl]